MRIIPVIPVLLSFLCCAFASANETSTPWAGTHPSKSRLILESASTDGMGVMHAGLHIRLEDGWWTYWRAPGSSGFPPQFDWSGSENLAEPPEVVWPVPLRSVKYGEALNLYRQEVVFPIDFRPAKPGKPVKLKLRFSFGTCRNVCVPGFAEHEIIVTPKHGSLRVIDQPNAKLIAAFTQKRPTQDPGEMGMEIREVWESTIGRSRFVNLRVKGLQSNSRPLVLIEAAGIFQANEVTPKPDRDRKVHTLGVKLNKSADYRELSGKRLRITVIAGGRALEQIWVVGAGSSSVVGIGLTPVASGRTDPPEH